MRISFLRIVLSFVVSFICTAPRSIMAFSGPIALNVKFSVKADRREEFLQVIQEDRIQTLTTEPGALQFVLGEDIEIPNIFYLHEQYKAMTDVEYHQSTSHFMKWEKFCASNPFTEEPIIQIYNCNHVARKIPTRSAYCLNVELNIKPEFRDEFMDVILNNQKNSEQEPLCLQYHFGESIDKSNTFYFHEQYKGEDQGKEGFVAHTKTPHFVKWEQFVATSPFTMDPTIQFYQALD